MSKNQLCYQSEDLAKEFRLFGSRNPDACRKHIRGLVSFSTVIEKVRELRSLDSETYIEKVIGLLETNVRPSATTLIQKIGEARNVVSEGPFYSAIVRLEEDLEIFDIGVIAQDRTVANGAWMPNHHTLAHERALRFRDLGLPVVCFVDTPGAEANEQANLQNQAHSISKLITTMGCLEIPTIGIIYGLGYSGGAIPFAACNINLALRDSAFSTIQPKGLSSIARRLNLSWQRCAQIVGVSAFELFEAGILEGVIDYTPSDDEYRVQNVRLAIMSSVKFLEATTATMIAKDDDVQRQYLSQSISYAMPSESEAQLRHSIATKPEKPALSLKSFLYPNIFGLAYRHLRYLTIRQKIASIPINQLGQMREDTAAPSSDNTKTHTLNGFYMWAQDAGKIIYQSNSFVKSWKRYREAYASKNSAAGRLSKLLFGSPQKRFEQEQIIFPKVYTSELFQQWKNNGASMMLMLHEFLQKPDGPPTLFTVEQVKDPYMFADNIIKETPPLAEVCSNWSIKNLASIKKIVLTTTHHNISAADRTTIAELIALECNLMIAAGDNLKDIQVTLANYLSLPAKPKGSTLGHIESLYDILLLPNLQDTIQKEVRNLIFFDCFYDFLISQLDIIAEGGLRHNAIPESVLSSFFEKGWEKIQDTYISLLNNPSTDKENFIAYCIGLQHREGQKFLNKIEEWKSSQHPRTSETLFVIITDIFGRILPLWLHKKNRGIAYQGKFKPQQIGKIKDFWNRLTIAYQDLLIQKLLNRIKRQSPISSKEIIKQYFIDFHEILQNRVSSDPCNFPGFRTSISKAIKNNRTPSGLITGIGIYDDGVQKSKMGVVVSNPDFQAGAFDMASGEKFCALIAQCSDLNIPIVGFISSGGMQTKEGAGALFSMAVVNDKLTRFIEDYDLPVLFFGFGDCTGGAQASFVTHPKVFKYYFSATNMPFAGQIVVPSYLPYRSTLSNYLSIVPEAMDGLVRHPFIGDIDERLRSIDNSIPVPKNTVEGVISRILKGDYSVKDSKIEETSEHQKEERRFVPIKKVLIHARGCTASKLIRVAKEIGKQVVLVQSDPDMDSSVAEQLDISKGDTLVALGGNTSDESYLNSLSVIRVALRENADALHPGIGFLSENPNFAKLCREQNINFIGPLVYSMETMGNKSNAVKTALAHDVPVVPGSHGIVPNANQGALLAEDIGYPVLIKAVHGGGGKGIKVVEKPEDFIATFQQVSLEAKSAFGNGELYLEKYVTSIRHIEAQILRDTYGNCKIVGIRDCSVQRDKQKVIEESDSTMLTQALRETVIESATKLAHAVDYIGAGTVEFIFDLKNKSVYFMEMNTRLQVEHPVTEKTSGVNIVAEQFRISGGESIENLKCNKDGYSIEVRVTAEKLVKSPVGEFLFRADPGLVTKCFYPSDPRIDVISAIASGKVISPYYDSLIAQIIIHEKNRPAAIRGMVDYLKAVQIKGISTNIPLLISILKDTTFQDGIFDTDYLPTLLSTVDTEALSKEMSAHSATSLKLDKSLIEIPESGELKVLSPGTGIFYYSPSPVDPPFVHEGESFNSEKTICLIEAMKVFSPLKLKDFMIDDKPIYDPTCTYTLTRTNQQNGQQINAGDLLFVIKPNNK